MSVITAAPRFKVQEKQEDFLGDRNINSEIRRRVHSYLRDPSYIQHFDLRIDPKDLSMVTFGTGTFGLKVLMKAPERIYAKLDIECRFVESAAHLTADVIARMAQNVLSAYEKKAKAPKTFTSINGYEMNNGVAVDDVFEIFLHGAEDWHPKKS